MPSPGAAIEPGGAAVIVATAGHVDHGKTSLVRALTGVDTDRLPEERRRGMTIEPGHAHTDLGAGPLAFVDVPGHERFLRQALVGLSAVDAALLVVAADDGPMPQTREHLAVLQLLGVSQGVVALTKTDRVDAARVAAVRAAVAVLLQGTALADAPVLSLSTVTGDGLPALREHLLWLQQHAAPPAADGAFRLAVDRAFVRAGHGLVVTGAVRSGRVRVGDGLTVSPSGQAARVRALQVMGRDVDEACAGQRCALNLAGIDRQEAARGTWLLAPALHAPTTRLDVQLHLLPGVGLPARAGTLWHLHLGAAALPVRVLAWPPGDDGAGSGAWARLLLPQPVSALWGDRFVLRDPAAQGVVGGGWVVDPFAPARGRSRPGRLAELRALARPRAADRLAQALPLWAGGIEWPPLLRAWNLDDAAAQALLDTVPHHRLPHARGLRLLSPAVWSAALQAVDDVLQAWHCQHPQHAGPTQAELLAALITHGQVDALLRLAALRQRLADGAVQRRGFVLCQPGHAPLQDPAEAPLLARTLAVVAAQGLRPPPLGDLAPALGLPLNAAAAWLQRAAAQGHLVQVARNRFFLPQTVDALVQVVRATAAAAPDGRFDAAAFRDRSGVGRNLSIQLLEFFDREGLTRFAGDRRTLRDDGQG
jgi:selenocysteine-specific elongation factor